ncbi:MAG: cytoplasmic protein [Clostridia bacterium]|nr:cytoplasmic protein [Clostridia bacterium]
MKNAVMKAHDFCINNRGALMGDAVCGCFYCLKIFSPSEIEEWIQDEKETAICPYCGIDSIIGESSGYPITKEFLEEMQKYWF